MGDSLGDENSPPLATTTPTEGRGPLPPQEEDDDDALECRVCRGEADPDRPLYAPCMCAGSIMYTHQVREITLPLILNTWPSE